MAIAYALFLDKRSHKKGVGGCEGEGYSSLSHPYFPFPWEQIGKMGLP
jgi:hypothetical protein